MKRITPFFLIMLLLCAAEAFGAGTPAALVKLKEQWQSWISYLVVIGLVVSTGTVVLGYVFKVKFFQMLADEYTKSLIIIFAISVSLGYFNSEIAEQIARMQNPFNL